MRLMTNRTRLRIDLALAEADDPPSPTAAPARRQLLAPPAPDSGSDRARPTLLAPGREQSARLASPGTQRS